MSNFNLDALTPYSVVNAASQASTVTSAAVNLMTDDLESVVFIQNIGAVTGSITGKIQESADGSTGWADVSGAAFTAVSSANNTQALSLNPSATAGYVRYVGTIATGPALTSVTMLGRKKTA